VIEAQEHQMVRNVFRLDDRQVGSMMIPRAEIRWLDLNASIEQVLHTVAEEQHSRYPVCRGSLDDVVGVVAAHDLLAPMSRGHIDPWTTTSSRRCSCPRPCRAWNCWSTSAAPVPSWCSWWTSTARCRA
jgi:CBS domain containing-hemolysin-like protein